MCGVFRPTLVAVVVVVEVVGVVVTPATLNELRCRAHFSLSTNQITWSWLLIQIHILNDKQGSTRFAKAGHFRDQQDQG